MRTATPRPASPRSDIGASAGRLWRAGRWELNGFARGDKLANRPSIGPVIVNEGNSRFFEPAPGRTWLAGARATQSAF